MNYCDDILFVGNGGGFLSCDADAGIFQAFIDYNIVPGKAMASSGSALFTSLFYSQGIDFIVDLITNYQPSGFIDILPYQAFKTLYGKSNRMVGNFKIRKLLEDNMTGEASKRVKVSVTRLDDWSTHMKSATPAFTLAATSIPFIFMPVKIGGQIWGDGGIFNNIPSPSMSETKNWKHIFVFVAPETEPYNNPTGITGALNLLNAVFGRELAQMKESGFFDLPNVTLIQPESAFGGGLFKWSDDLKLKQHSYELTLSKLKELDLK